MGLVCRSSSLVVFTRFLLSNNLATSPCGEKSKFTDQSAAKGTSTRERADGLAPGAATPLVVCAPHLRSVGGERRMVAVSFESRRTHSRPFAASTGFDRQACHTRRTPHQSSSPGKVT